MQSLPSIRLVEENDKSLVGKINSTLMNTVPLWETQLAQAVTIQRSKEAAEAIRDANDLTNELLTKNAETVSYTHLDVYKRQHILGHMPGVSGAEGPCPPKVFRRFPC